MEILAIQKCFEITREINRVEKRITEKAFQIQLFKHEITVKGERFSISSVFDISYYLKKAEGDTIGFLYLHTNQGIRSYYIKEKPEEFIDAYRRLKTK